MTLYARSEDDVDPEEIMRQVKKSTSNFTFVAPKEDYSSPQAVVSLKISEMKIVIVTTWLKLVWLVTKLSFENTFVLVVLQQDLKR